MNFTKLSFLFCLIITTLCACSDPEIVKPTTTKPPTPVETHLTEQDLKQATYKFKIIFHFLQNKRSTLSRVHSNDMQEIVDVINRFYNGYNSQTNANVKFELADKSPKGKTMSEKGITRNNITEDSISYQSLIAEEAGHKFHDIGWDRTKYINIYVYTTKEKDIGGVSTVPKMPKEVAKKGDLISMGNDYKSYNVSITLQESLLGYWLKYNNRLSSDFNPANVLAHELGHYLGLYHCFRSPNDENDYCDDTKEYDREEYMRTFYRLVPKIEAASTIKEYREVTDTLFLRRAISDGSIFRSDNIMDYFYTSGNKFTPDQIKRIRRFLYYSTTVPGPKVYLSKKGSRATTTKRSKPYIII